MVVGNPHGGFSSSTFTKPKTPSKPNWCYVVVNNKPLYNANSSQDFELHLSEESELVYKILTLFGINLQKPDLAQAAAQMEVSKIQQEKS